MRDKQMTREIQTLKRMYVDGELTLDEFESEVEQAIENPRPRFEGQVVY